MAMQLMQEQSEKMAKAGQMMVFAQSEEDIGKIAKQHHKLVMQKSNGFYDIDVSVAMAQLAGCGSLLQLAYASTDGSECQTDVALLLSKYSSMVKDSWIASSSFVRASLTALKFHKLALKMAQKGKSQKAVKFVSKCMEVAQEMANTSDGLANRAQTLSDIAEKAFAKCVADKNLSVIQRKKIEKSKKEAEVLTKQLQRSTKQMALDLDEAKEMVEAAVAKADSQRQRQFIMQLISCVNPRSIVTDFAKILNGDNAPSSSHKQKQNQPQNGDDQKEQVQPQSNGIDAHVVELEKQRHEIRKNLLKQNGQLRDALVELSGLTLQKDSLAKAVKSLEIAIKALGKIKIIFDKTRVFWIGVKNNCKAIVSDDTVQEMEEDKEELIEAISNSALTWFVLGKVNYEAKAAISKVDKKMDNILSDLPTEDQAQKMIDPMVRELQGLLAEEEKAIKASADK